MSKKIIIQGIIVKYCVGHFLTNGVIYHTITDQHRPELYIFISTLIICAISENLSKLVPENKTYIK